MHIYRLIIVAIIVALAACGTNPAAVTDALTSAGALNIRDKEIASDVPVPHSYTSHKTFEVARIAPKGGQVFVCDTKKNCDAIYAYFDFLKGLAGPYLYQSPNGLVVVQLNSSLTPSEATRFEQAIKGLP